MTTSEGTSFPSRFTRIDDLTRDDHNHLLPEDECLFFGDYTARKGWAHSATNQLILNFKSCPPDTRNHPRRAARARLSALPATALRGEVLPERVPAEGLLILRDGEPGEPEVTLSPLPTTTSTGPRSRRSCRAPTVTPPSTR
jgi:hypothetical protein